jgi:hypothetical protein
MSPSSAAIFSNTFINFSACSCVIHYPLNYTPNPLATLAAILLQAEQASP